MVEILKLTRYLWTKADGKRVTITQVTFRDRQGGIHLLPLEGDLDMAAVERRLARLRPERRRRV